MNIQIDGIPGVILLAFILWCAFLGFVMSIEWFITSLTRLFS